MLYKDREHILMLPILSRTISFLSKDMNIKLKKNAFEPKCMNGMQFQAQSAMLEIVGQYKATIIMSFSKVLLNVLADKFNGGEVISDEEKDELLASVAQEIINTVVGNALQNIQEEGKEINISTPSSFTDINFVYNKEHFLSINLNTQYGPLSIGLSDSNLILENGLQNSIAKAMVL